MQTSRIETRDSLSIDLKVDGDAPNSDPDARTRDAVGSKHSLFGASKVAADVMVQKYGRYFGMPTVCLYGGCLTGQATLESNCTGF